MYTQPSIFGPILTGAVRVVEGARLEIDSGRACGRTPKGTKALRLELLLTPRSFSMRGETTVFDAGFQGHLTQF
jgi:hypothetical protein